MSKSAIDTKQLEAKMIMRGFKTRRSFAQAVEVSEHSVSNLLNGVYNPSYVLMNKIFRVLHLTADEGMSIFFNEHLREEKGGASHESTA
ncbi:helix-turn-helix domain-containing protein [Bacillus cereus]